jgi:hypothetical protein
MRAILGLAILAGPGLTRIEAQPTLSFAVASIRMHHGAERLTNRFHLAHGGSFTASNCSLALLLN